MTLAFRPKKFEKLETYAYHDGILTPEDCDRAEAEFFAKASMQKALVGSHGGHFSGYEPETRESDISWLEHGPSTSWLFEKLAVGVQGINEDFFGFDLFGMDEGIQCTQYVPGQHFKWHMDGACAGHPNRKLSMVAILSRPEEYEGGELQLWTGPEPLTLDKRRCRVYFFPSYILHRVTPVTKGLRRTLVAWTSGPSFR